MTAAGEIWIRYLLQSLQYGYNYGYYYNPFYYQLPGL